MTDETRCIERVSIARMWGDYQCQRKRGFGPNGEFCKQHSPEEKEKRMKRSEAKWEAERKLREAPRLELIRLQEIELLAGELADSILSAGRPEDEIVLADRLKAKIDEGKGK